MVKVGCLFAAIGGRLPCQPFSVAGEKRGFKDDRGLLFLHIIRLLKEFGPRRPKALLLENVKNFRSHDKGRTFRRVQAEVQKAGYWFTESNAQVLNTATHTHIPQNRERLFMVALSTDWFAANTFQFPSAVPSLARRSVRDEASLFEGPICIPHSHADREQRGNTSDRAPAACAAVVPPGHSREESPRSRAVGRTYSVSRYLHQPDAHPSPPPV